MNVYLIHTLCRRVLHDEGFRELILENPEAAVSSMPFSDEERKALLAGDVARLYREGALAFLLLILSRSRSSAWSFQSSIGGCAIRSLGRT
jgi:hypothetical protein